ASDQARAVHTQGQILVGPGRARVTLDGLLGLLVGPAALHGPGGCTEIRARQLGVALEHGAANPSGSRTTIERSCLLLALNREIAGGMRLANGAFDVLE